MTKQRKNFVQAFGSKGRNRSWNGPKGERRQDHAMLDQERWDEMPGQAKMRANDRRSWRITYETPVLNAIDAYRGRSVDEFWSYLNQHIDQRTERYHELRRVVNSILRLDGETITWVDGEPYVRSWRFGQGIRPLSELQHRRHRYYIHPERKTIEFWPYDPPKPTKPKFINLVRFEQFDYERRPSGAWYRLVPPREKDLNQFVSWSVTAEQLVPVPQNVSRRTAKKLERLWKKINQRALAILERQDSAPKTT